MHRRYINPLGILLIGLSFFACERRSNESKAGVNLEALPASPKEQAAKAAAAKAAKSSTLGVENKRLMMAVLPKGEKLQKVVNPLNQEAYSGATGTVRGVVKVTGDSAPVLPKLLRDMESTCDRARQLFGRQFREGEGRTLGDVFVAVTGYDGFVPAKTNEIKVEAKGCAWNRRTYGVTLGQYLQIEGADRRAYVPELLGQPMPAQLFVLPTAPPVILPPQKPGRYVLLDSMRLYNTAEVFVVAYTTFDVTDLDGKFEISNVPVGSLKLNAFSPALAKTVEQTVEVKADEVTNVALEIQFELPASSK